MSFIDQEDYDESRVGDEMDRHRPIHWPMEIHLSDRNGKERYIITATVGDNGALNIHMRINGHGASHALSNLQSPRVCPTIARPGWQEDLIWFAKGGIYIVHDIEWGLTP